MEEISEMSNILTKLSLDKYMMCKYAILSKCNSCESKHFFTKLFEVTDKRRPKLLEIK